jgi:xanthine dehydrogenase YagS FAD-binding subunit
MNPFTFTTAHDIAGAVQERSAHQRARFIAGGTNLLDLMKENVERPTRLIDITHLPLTEIRSQPDGTLRLGALVTNSAAAYDDRVRSQFPLLAQAILAGASPQLRNMATIGGNLMQRTRCYYFYDTATPCNKRERGAGCSAIEGFNRIHAILGASDHCIATHPSDMCVALAALDAVVHVVGPHGSRTIPFAEFHRLPEDRPDTDTTLRSDEIITAVDLPPNAVARHSSYLKIRDRRSYAFALVSVAAALEMDDGIIAAARIALGGVAHKPWRDRDAEAALRGKTADRANIRAAAEIVLRDARGLAHNAFKIELAKRAIVRAVTTAAAGRPWP